MNHQQQLAQSILERLDHIRDTDVACITALAAYADAADQLEANDHALFRRLDSALVHVFASLMQAAWRDGYAVGQDPTLLIFAQQETSAVAMPFTWQVVAPGVEIAQSASDYVDDLLDGEGGAA